METSKRCLSSQTSAGGFPSHKGSATGVTMLKTFMSQSCVLLVLLLLTVTPKCYSLSVQKSPSLGDQKSPSLSDEKSPSLSDLKSPSLSSASYSSVPTTPVCDERSCTSQTNILCRISKRSQYCMHREESATDFPNKPRNGKVEQTQKGNYTHFNITWQAPFDYSYRAVKGYELRVTTFDALGVHSQYCYFVNLTGTNWTAVTNVHNVTFYLDCWRVPTLGSRSVHVVIYSYPKVENSNDPKMIEIKVPVIPPNTSGFQWEPSIDAVALVSNKSLVVSVTPRHDRVDHLQVCVTIHHACAGSVSPMQSPKDMFRYSVSGLASNHSYYIYIKPISKDNKTLDKWIHKQDPVFIMPWPQAPPKEVEHVNESVVTEVLVALILIAIIAAAALVCLWYKGCLHKIKLFRCCLPQSAYPSQPIKLLQLYVVESAEFQDVVQAHVGLLAKFLAIEPRDCTQVRHQQNADQLLQDWCADSRLLVYVSPQLMAALRCQEGRGAGGGEDSTEGLEADPPPMASKCIQLLQRVVSTAALKKGRGGKPVLLLSGCFPSDADAERDLSAHPSLGGLQRHWVSRESRLLDPVPLLAKLSGCHRSLIPSRDWRHSQQAQALQAAVTRLQRQTDYANINRDDMKMGELDQPADCGLDHIYTSVTWPGNEGRGPHRSDSGFSSAMDHNRCSNPSSEGNSSPGVVGMDECAEEDVHTERDPFLQQGLSARSVSQMFQPPDSVMGGDTDSVIFAELQKVNRVGESHWVHA